MTAKILLVVGIIATWLQPGSSTASSSSFFSSSPSSSSSIVQLTTEFHTFNVDDELFRVVHPKGHVDIDWGLTLPAGVKGENCSEGEFCLDFGVAKVVLTQDDHCHKVSWTATNLTELEDCVIIDGHWYGGGEVSSYPWPFETVPRLTSSPFSTGRGWFQTLAEAYWVSSQGVALRVEEGTPLFLTLPDTNHDLVGDRLCLSAKQNWPFAAPSAEVPLTLNYFICTGSNVKEVHMMSYRKFFSTPRGLPDMRMFQDPIWSTWAEFGRDINEDKIRDFAMNIKSRGFNYSQISIDDNWETCYGDLIFNPDNFSDPKAMVEDLHNNDFRVSLWTHPFINVGCDSYKYCEEKGYFVKDINGMTLNTTWWTGTAGMVDFTNKEAVTWWSQRLLNLRDTIGIDSFKFDAGEASFLPKGYTLDAPRQLWPNVFTTKYVEAITAFGNMAEIKAGLGTQTYPNFMRMADKDSLWEGGLINGLRALIPSLLNFGLVGYPYALPDMIGGNAYGIRKPTAELMIRWAQASALMPGLQFSYVPWRFSEDVVDRCKDASALHAEMMPLITEVAQETMETGAPIMRPTWWLCPEIEMCLTADQQFLIGSDVLVTPVLHKGATILDVVLPPGQWLRVDTGEVYSGPDTITLNNITISTIVYFKKVE